MLIVDYPYAEATCRKLDDRQLVADSSEERHMADAKVVFTNSNPKYGIGRDCQGSVTKNARGRLLLAGDRRHGGSGHRFLRN